jgi:hypothetical protein
VQLRHQPIDTRGNIAPIAQPVARKTNADLRAIERTLVDAGAGSRTGSTRAASEKLFRFVCGIDQVFAVIKRGAARTAGPSGPAAACAAT